MSLSDRGTHFCNIVAEGRLTKQATLRPFKGSEKTWKRISVATMLLAGYATLVLAAEPTSYLCIADKSTGFKFNNGEWESVNFNVKNSKYTLTKKEGRWLWKEFGSKYDSYCDGDFNEYGFLHCSDIQEVKINKQTLRYQSVYGIGYVTTADLKVKPGNTPMIEIMRCTAL